MQRSIITVPASLMNELRMTWDIEWRGQRGGDFNDGTTQTVYNAFPRWVGSPELALSGSEITAWRAVRATAQGIKNVYRLPMVDPLGFDRLAVGGALATAGITFSTGATFGTGQGYAYSPCALAVGAFSAGATEIRLDTSPTGVAPVAGQIMSHNDRPFMVSWVDPVSGSIYDIGVQMPIRAAIADDDVVLMEGHGLFEATEETMGNPAYDGTRHSSFGLGFREWLR